MVEIGTFVRSLWAGSEKRRGRVVWAAVTTVLAVVFTLCAMALWPEAAKSVAPPVRSATTTQVARQCRDDVPCPSTMVSRFRARALGSSGSAMVRKTTEIRVVCGGAAVIGSLKGGGLWGAGRGGAACLWTYAVKDGLY